MTFLLDENISGHTAKFLRVAGHAVWRCEPQTGDTVILARAEAASALILTRDHDFLSFLPSRAGILYLRIHPSIARDITNAVQHLLAGTSATSLYGRVVIVSRTGFEILP